MGRSERNALAAVELFERMGPRSAGLPGGHSKAPSSLGPAARHAARPANAPSHSPEVLRILESMSTALVQIQTQVAELAAATSSLPPQPPPQDLDPEMSSAATTLRFLRDSDPACTRQRMDGRPARKKKRSDVGRRVSVLWVPRDFDDALEPAPEDLAPFSGLVLKKRNRSLLVKYDDGSLAWARKDKLLSFLD